MNGFLLPELDSCMEGGGAEKQEGLMTSTEKKNHFRGGASHYVNSYHTRKSAVTLKISRIECRESPSNTQSDSLSGAQTKKN